MTKSIIIDLSVSLHIGTQELQTWHEFKMFENEVAKCIYAHKRKCDKNGEITYWENL